MTDTCIYVKPMVLLKTPGNNLINRIFPTNVQTRRAGRDNYARRGIPIVSNRE
jgi:hypothetical protein